MARRDEGYWRERAAVLYRALRDDYAARGATVVELGTLIGADGPGAVHQVLNWMRAHGVALVCARSQAGRGPAEFPARWALRSALPAAWDGVIPHDGSAVEIVAGTTVNEMVGAIPISE